MNFKDHNFYSFIKYFIGLEACIIIVCELSKCNDIRTMFSKQKHNPISPFYNQNVDRNYNNYMFIFHLSWFI